MEAIYPRRRNPSGSALGKAVKTGGIEMYDLIIIGAGVSGCCIAREISRYKIKACVIEKGDDVASGTSKANTGVIHTGLEAPPGSLMAELCVRGNELMYEWAKDLNFPAEKNGKLIVCTHEEDMPLLYEQ